MLKTQQELLDYLKKLAQVVEKIQAAGVEVKDKSQAIREFEAQVRQRELLVPVVGAFSAGKSTLLNAIMGSSILPMDIKPETAIPTELRHDTHERLEAFFEDGRTEQYGIDQLPALQARAQEFKFLRLYLNRPALKELAPLVLVDMPGFNSPLDAHNKAITNYIGDGAHYLFVVSVEEGALHQEIVSNIAVVDELGRGFTVCINKADLKPAADVQDIYNYINDQLGDAGFSAKVCPVSKNDISSVKAMLRSFNPDEIFGGIFRTALLNHNQATEEVVATALKGLESDKESNARKIQEMEKALVALEEERKQQTQAGKGGNLEQVADDIMRTVRNRLAGSVDMLARAALRSQDEMASMVANEVRSGLTIGMKRATDSMSARMVSEFSQHVTGSLRPEINLSQNQSNWTETLLQTLQSQLLPDLLSGLGGKSGVAGGLVASLMSGAAATKFIPHPILKVVTAILPGLLGALFNSLGDGQKLEQAKEAIRAQVLPSVESQLRPQVLEFLLQAQEQLVQAVSSAFDERIKEQKEILENINKEAESDNLQERIDALKNARAEIRSLASAHLQIVQN